MRLFWYLVALFVLLSFIINESSGAQKGKTTKKPKPVTKKRTYKIRPVTKPTQTKKTTQKPNKPPVDKVQDVK
jgi:hypothetical protein